MMNKAVGLFIISILFISGFAISQNDLSDQINSQTREFFHRFSENTAESHIITAQDMASSSSVKAIASEIIPSNVCLSLGKYSSSPEWFLGSGGKTIRYLKEFDQELEFFVFCEKGSKLKQVASFFPEEKINEDYISHCPQLTPENEEVVCAVILANTTPFSGQESSVSYQIFFLFGILVILPLLFLFSSKNINVKLFTLIKTVFLLLLFVVFYLFNLILSGITTVLLLFFFFVQINLSIAPIILGLYADETSLIKLGIKLVLLLETVGLIVSLILIAPLL
ncbi:MAG: hypothetical protein CL944_03175 [Candidatus Diapherotrites archaeon]|uniref:Uncharacterized protein n=1 Tax=Candidatus Iainarchaeum sp. TaxID=3101447 RepID=A0A2D6LQQ9_9ARCH|nr:hypothetical protein [Candidatus Diapherotrites archaeon]